MANRQTVGFAGIGNMGAPMVRCLAKAGFAVVVFDPRAAAVEPFRTGVAGVSIADDLTALGRAAGIVITMLPDSGVVRRAVIGEAGAPGLIAGLAPGALVVDMSSSYAPDTVRLGAELAAAGFALIDAPVSGGVPKAIAGSLAIMTGGAAAHIDRAAGVLAAMGTVHRTGRLGSGHAMKALNNYVSAAGLIATCEALAIGQRFGLDGAVMTEILNASTGRNNTTENKVQRYILNGAFNSGFSLALMDKDVAMARALAAELGVAAGELDFVSDALGRAGRALGPSADHTAVYAYVTGDKPRG